MKIRHKKKGIALIIFVVVILFLFIQVFVDRYFDHSVPPDAQDGRNTAVADSVVKGHNGMSSDDHPVELNHHLLEAEAYRQSAEEGDAQAQYEMGEAYRHGQKIPDDDRALHWYRLSAAQGYAMALYQLGAIYQAQGRSLELVYALFRSAIAYSDAPLPVVDERISQIKPQLSTEQLKTAEELAKKLQNGDQFDDVLNEALLRQ